MLFEVKYKVFVYRKRVLLLTGDKMTPKLKKIQVGVKKLQFIIIVFRVFLR